MKARFLTFAVLLAAVLVGHVVALRFSPEYRARVHEFEEGFLDFLVANSQESFQKAIPEVSPDVVLVDFREEDKTDFSAWPPAPLDYIMLMKKLAPAEPEVMAFVEPLRWDAADTQFIQQLRNALLPVPSIVLGFEVATEAVAIEMSPEQQEFFASGMPSFTSGASDPAAATVVFKSVTRLPDRALQIGTELGVARVSAQSSSPAEAEVKTETGAGTETVAGNKAQAQVDALFPFVVTDGTRLVPSLAAQAVSRFRHMPSSALHLRLGTGGRLGLSDTHIVPLEKGGAMTLQEKPTVPKLDALALFNPLAEEAALAATEETLGKGKVIVIGTGQMAESQARAIAQALAVPHLHRAPPWGDWAFAGVMVLFSLWQFRGGRMKALLVGIVIAAIAAITCMLTFQSSLWWWSPAPAVVVLATTTLFCFVWPRRKVEQEQTTQIHGEPAPTGATN